MAAAEADVIELSSRALSAAFAPALGGRLTRLRHSSGADIIVPLVETVFDPMFWPKAGGYPLVPYHNRIVDGQLSFEGRGIALVPHPDSLPHSLHGPAHRRPWTSQGATEGALTLRLDYAPDDDWPWAFSAWQTFRLHDATMTIELGVRNASNSNMPAGLGWHPYFPGVAATEQDGEYVWPHSGDYLPDGRRLSADDPAIDRRVSTVYLQTWGSARMRLPGGALVVLSADPIFEHLVLHQGPTYTCIEAATHVANGFNLAATGTPFTGTKVLGPGETLEGSIRISVVGS